MQVDIAPNAMAKVTKITQKRILFEVSCLKQNQDFFKLKNLLIQLIFFSKTIYTKNLYGNVNFAFPVGQVDTKANATDALRIGTAPQSATTEGITFLPATDCDTITIIGVKYVAYFGPCGIRMICDGSLNVFAASLVG